MRPLCSIITRAGCGRLLTPSLLLASSVLLLPVAQAVDTIPSLYAPLEAGRLDSDARDYALERTDSTRRETWGLGVSGAAVNDWNIPAYSSAQSSAFRATVPWIELQLRFARLIPTTETLRPQIGLGYGLAERGLGSNSQRVHALQVRPSLWWVPLGGKSLLGFLRPALGAQFPLRLALATPAPFSDGGTDRQIRPSFSAELGFSLASLGGILKRCEPWVATTFERAPTRFVSALEAGLRAEL